MIYRILIVDDSAFFRRQIKSIIDQHPELEVVGEASQGKEAVDAAIKLKPDVITMDYEMPLMDGITAVKEIMKKAPTAILMFSSLTHSGAKVTLDALDAGAIDFLPKGYENVSNPNSKLRVQLVEKILEVAKNYRRGRSAVSTGSSAKLRPVSGRKSFVNYGKSRPDLILLGTSTGGPVALQTILTALPANFSVPILMIQHMPGAFTGAFAERLNTKCKISVKEAADGDMLAPGLALLAPGGLQMMLSAKNKVRILAGDERLNYKPSVDITFGSAAKYYSSNIVAAVLTGMGSDGKEGARLLKARGGHIWAQEGSTCVIDGMPSAIVKAELAENIVPLDEIAKRLIEICK